MLSVMHDNPSSRRSHNVPECGGLSMLLAFDGGVRVVVVGRKLAGVEVQHSTSFWCKWLYLDQRSPVLTVGGFLLTLY